MGAYLFADMNDHVLVILTRDVVDILLKTNPGYTDFVTTENGRNAPPIILFKVLH